MPLSLQSSLKTLMPSRKQTQEGVFSLCHVRCLELSRKVTLPMKCSESRCEGQYFWLKRDRGVTSWAFRMTMCIGISMHEMDAKTAAGISLLFTVLWH